MTSIDYSMGTANFDQETGMHYGVIPLNDLGEGSFEEIMQNGTDVDYESAMEELKSELTRAIKSTLEDYCKADWASIAEEVISDLDLDYESTGDCVRYRYEQNGTILKTDSSGDLWVIKSPYFAMCSYCSPCAPGAGHLLTEGEVETYCLGPDWFDSDHPMPYQCLSVADCSKVTA